MNLKNKNKKGFVLTTTFVLIAIAVIFLVWLKFSTSLQTFVFPIAIGGFAGFMLYTLNKGNKTFKDNYFINVFFIFLLVVSMGFLIYNSSVQAFNPTNVEILGVPAYATLTCASTGTIDYAGGQKLGGDGVGWITAPENSVSFDIVLNYPERSFLERGIGVYLQQCDNSDTNMNDCDTEFYYDIDGKDELINSPIDTNFDSDRPVRVRIVRTTADTFRSVDDTDRAVFDVRFVPYQLQRNDILQGGINFIGTDNCYLPTSIKEVEKAIIYSEDENAQNLFVPKASLEPNENYNYITGIISLFSNGAKELYNNQEAYCIQQGNTATMYSFMEVSTYDGTKYKIVDTNNEIATGLECCNNLDYGGVSQCINNELVVVNIEEEYDEFGNLVGAVTDIQCSLLNPCPTGKLVYGSGSMSFEYDCINDVCQAVNLQIEECALHSDCGVGEICVDFTCQDSGNMIIEDTHKNILDCSEFEYETEIFERATFLGIPYGTPKATGEYQCKLKPTYAWGIGLGALLIFLGVAVAFRPKEYSNKQKSNKILNNRRY